MAVTARTIIQGALKMLGVLDPSEAMKPEDAEDGLVMLNNLIDAWNIERLYIFTISEVVATFAGSSATIGPGMQINTPRPVRIESAFYRRSNIDYPLRIIDVSEYNAIGLKTVSGDYPEVMYYTGDSPTGNVFVWPVPSANEYHFQLMSQLSAFSGLDVSYSLPQGYGKALMYTMADELAPIYGKQAAPSILRIGASMRRSLKRANVNTPSLSVNLPSNSAANGRINIISNQ